MNNFKKFEDYNHLNEEKKELTAKEFIFDRYKKYFANKSFSKESFKELEDMELPISRVIILMEEYYKLKTK